MDSNALELAVAALLTAHGYGRERFSLEPISASGNNRVFKLQCAGQKLVLKWYFHDVTDHRDRLGAEYAFLEHAWNLGLRCIPQPLGKDLATHLAIYEYVDGNKLEAHQVDTTAVLQAGKFFASLNCHQSRTLASLLPSASEACFSVAEHFTMVDARLARLKHMPVESELDQVAYAFVTRLDDYWVTTKNRLLEGCGLLDIEPDDVLPPSDRCLSPSDFGFHNALMRPDGSLCFIDFEYAGWDDPVKAVGDFFSHPGVAVPREHFELFLEQALAPFENSQYAAQRVRMFEPISQVKWCCIILNEFLPSAARRRHFANPVTDALEIKRRQLGKAEKLFNSLKY